jgi:hypothetical protein
MNPPPLPRPGAQKAALPAKKKMTHWEALFRVLSVVLIVGSITFAWWVYSYRLVPLQQQSRQLNTALTQLSAEVETIQRKWPAVVREEIRTQYKEVHNKLFANEAELGRWLVRLQEDAGPLALDINVDWGKNIPRTAEQEKLAIVPASVTLEVRPAIGGNQTPYQRMLRLGQQLAAEGKRADLAELDVNGGPLSITHGLLVFNLWAGEEKSPETLKH